MRVQLVSDTNYVIFQSMINSEIESIEKINHKVVDIKYSTCWNGYNRNLGDIVYSAIIMYKKV